MQPGRSLLRGLLLGVEMPLEAPPEKKGPATSPHLFPVTRKGFVLILPVTSNSLDGKATEHAAYRTWPIITNPIELRAKSNEAYGVSSIGSTTNLAKADLRAFPPLSLIVQYDPVPLSHFVHDTHMLS